MHSETSRVGNGALQGMQQSHCTNWNPVDPPPLSLPLLLTYPYFSYHHYPYFPTTITPIFPPLLPPIFLTSHYNHHSYYLYY